MLEQIIIAIISAIAGGFVGWFASIGLLQKKEYYKASKKFRDTFTDTIHYFKTFKKPSNPQFPIRDYFKKNMENYEKAIVDFLPYLKRSKRAALEDALENLKYAFEFEKILEIEDPENVIIDEDYKHSIYFMCYDGISQKNVNITWEKGLEIAQENINGIVEFGKVR